VRYADGTWAEIPIRDGIELRRWWVGRWYDNSGAASWPIFIGQNPYSMKWNQFVAVYAMEWANPHPDKSITSITLKSAALCSPAVFAITIADAQFSNGPNSKENYKRPPEVPAGYFDKKLALEQEMVFKEMVKQDMTKGPPSHRSSRSTRCPTPRSRAGATHTSAGGRATWARWNTRV
jgi:hypothetical protein